MKINRFKIGDRVQVVKSHHNASQFNNAPLSIMGAYQFSSWKDKVFLIEGSIRLTEFTHEGASVSAHLLTDLKGNPVGYVYSEAIDFAKKEYSYSLTTNTIWFDRDGGRVTAKSLDEAISLATQKITKDVAEINRRLDGFAVLNVNTDEISVEEIKSPK